MNTQQLFTPLQWVTLEGGRYQILDAAPLGSGGQNVVWKARREADRKIVVLRTLNLAQCTQDDLDLLLDYAAREMAFLQDLNCADAEQHYILPLWDKGGVSHADYPNIDFPVMVMPWYEQGDLTRFDRSLKRPSENLTAAKLLRWTRQLASALNYIHQQHKNQTVSIHRDIKPANIFLNAQGDVALADFGLVRAAVNLSMPTNIGTKTSFGTRGYGAPEQQLASHKNSDATPQYWITPAVDIYSLAMSVHALLVGSTHAQNSLTGDILHRHLAQLQLFSQQGHDDKIIGWLGKIGGLTAAEKTELHRVLLALFQPPTQGETVVGGKQACLPDADFMATQAVDILEKMLAPWPADRPHADEVMTVFAALESCLNPTLEYFKLEVDTPKLTGGQACQLRLILKGQGLPADLRGWGMQINGQPHALPAFASPTNVAGVLVAGMRHEITLVIDLPDAVATYQITLYIQINGVSRTQTVQCEVSLTAQQLWEQGAHLAALRMELRPEWLDALHRDVVKPNNPRKLAEALELQGIFSALQSHYPVAAPEQNVLKQALERLNKMEAVEPLNPVPPPVSPPKSPVEPANAKLRATRLATIGGVGVLSLAAWGYFAQPEKPPYVPPVINSPVSAVVEPVVVSSIPTVEQLQAIWAATQSSMVGASPLPEMVAIPNTYYEIGKYEVTQKQWQAVMGSLPPTLYFKNCGETCPVENVSWHDVQDFIQKLNVQTKKNYRLPTEAEWQTACLAGNSTEFCGGNDVDVVAWHLGNSGSTIHPVGQKNANGYGLADMSGNVLEWVEDCNDGGSNGGCSNRVLRGGSWLFIPLNSRAASRSYLTPAARNYIIGFRLARTLP